MGGIGRVVAADDDGQVGGGVEESYDGGLVVEGGVAEGVAGVGEVIADRGGWARGRWW